VPYAFPSGSPNQIPKEAKVLNKKEARAAREWNANQCEECSQPLRDCLCEDCEVCEESVSQCDCNRCEDCGTIYAAEDVLENLNDDNNCATCATEIGE